MSPKHPRSIEVNSIFGIIDAVPPPRRWRCHFICLFSRCL